MARIIIDMDEVMADIVPHMIEYYQQATGEKVDIEQLAGKHVHEAVSQPELIRQILLTPGFFRTAPLIKDSVTTIQALNNVHEVYIVSAAMEFPQSLIEKYEWLEEHFPFISWQQITLCGSKQLVSGDYMIDDHLKNLDYFNGEKLLFTSPHNVFIEKHTRINNWQEIANLLLPPVSNPFHAKFTQQAAV
ncbi:5'(3')-deoxyribonucleotidase [Filimonas lacunae]|uniref:5'(3')-deoxyribonucleotidase n=1 Tax=Filimonas lacunae TaxID=477680 RepID=A0A173MMQ4_9BACT|nr:hypothetical protein [Filimonas lacunae]BAV08766.1 5'(3')-deoxyribonucleotidase [Filimonas lacunae]SIS61392.1 5'(3')-deoxyribonucleotidase [Filimonas lacunae]